MSRIAGELRNFFAILADVASGSETSSADPAWLEFAPNNLCNLRCVMCNQADGLALAVMPQQAAIDLLDDVLPRASLWTPAALSEPMLAGIRLVVDKCREHDVLLNMHTNCTRLDAAAFESLADRIHKLWISFDSNRRDVLERLRVGIDYERVVANMRGVVAAAHRLAVPLGFVAVLMADNLGHLHELVDFLADMGAAEAGFDLRVQALQGDAPRLRAHDVFARHDASAIAAALDRACERATARGLLFHVDMPAPFGRQVVPRAPAVREVAAEVLLLLAAELRERFPHFCSMASHYVKVEPDGAVYPCCNAPPELRMGNVHEQPLRTIWNGERYRRFRRRMHARDYPSCCRTCDVLVGNPRFEAPTAGGAESAEAPQK